jgi:sugar lactone lactonase YvrE
MEKKRSLVVKKVNPTIGVPEGELVVDCRGFIPGSSSSALFGDVQAPILSASEDRVILRLPESPNCLGVALKTEEKVSPIFPFNLAIRLSADLHPVCNPVIAPDQTLITTISGGRGQQVPQPLVRVTRQGDKIPFHCDVMNPTGLAFSKNGQLYITSRNDGTLLRYTNYEQLDVIAEDLGIPCGLAFDSTGRIYVGDRTGKIFRIDLSGNKEVFAHLEPSISAYHLAMDSEDRLYVTGPTFSMRDSLFRLTKKGSARAILRGLARPQGMAFLADGDLLISAAYDGKKGIFRYSVKNGSLKHFITAPILVGLAVSGQDIFLATGNSIYLARIPGQTQVN